MVDVQVDVASSPTKVRPEPTKAAQPSNASPSDQVQRTEHDRLIRGEGAFVADHAAERQLHLAVVRSTIASGTIMSLDVGPALSVGGVVAAFTSADFERGVPVIPMRIVPVEAMQGCLQPVLASERVRYVGEPVAIVLAENPAAAEDGVEAVLVEYDDDEPRLTFHGPGHPVWDDLRDDEYCTFELANGDVDAAFAAADVTVSEDFTVQRHTSLPMETRGVVAEFDGSTLHLWGPTKYLRFTRQVVADALDLAAGQVICHHIDVGGMFGARGEVYPEDVLVPWAAQRVGRPVRWIEDRREHLLTINHAREHACRYEVAAAADGRLLAFRYTDTIDMGAYARPVGGRVAMLAAEAMPGPYKWDAFAGRTIAHASNKTPAGTMRGPSGFEVNFIRERALDLIARRLDMDPAELRLRNLIPRDEMPYQVDYGPTMESLTLDTGDYPKIFAEALDTLAYEPVRQDVQRRQNSGEIVGLGIGAFLDHSGLGKTETALLEIDEAGRIILGTTGSEIGQGIASMMQRVVAPILGVPVTDIHVVTNDTSYHDEGLGTYASRSTVFVGSAVHDGALKLKQELQTVVAAAAGCDPAEVEIGAAGATGPGVTMTWSELGPRRIVGRHEAPEPTFGFGFHLAVVRADPDTGLVIPEKVAVAYDCGRAIDHQGVIGQLAGATVQGLGGALFEELAYDEYGQPQSTSLADYMIPTATDVPDVDVHIIEDELVPSNPLGVKGAGEAGILGIGAALANALDNALCAAGAAEPVRSLPLKPQLVADVLGWTADLPTAKAGQARTVEPTATATVTPPALGRAIKVAALVSAALFVLRLLRRRTAS